MDVAGVEEQIDELLAGDVDALTDAEVHELVVGLHRCQARLAAMRGRVTQVWDRRRVWADDGSRSASARLGRACDLAPETARGEVRRARRLASMPATAAALAAGAISVDHLDLLVRANQPDVAAEFGRDEADLVRFCQQLSFPAAQRALTYWRHCANDTAAADHARRLRDGRYAHASRTLDGTVDIRALLDAIDGSIFLNELRRLEQQLFDADWAKARAEHGPNATADRLARTSAQRRADALALMARRSAAMAPDARPRRPLITILCGYETFAGRVCETDDGIVLTPEQARTLLHETDIERIVFDLPSRVIDVSHRRRFFTGGLRRAIEVRDRYCTHPAGCDVPASQCDIDHKTPYARGGPTTQTNGRLRCPPHNPSDSGSEGDDQRGPP